MSSRRPPAWSGLSRRTLLRLSPGLALLAVDAGGCASEPATLRPPELGGSAAISELEALAALARLHGYVRYFHPSDAAAEADWDARTVAGARALLGCEDRRELQAALLRWLAPVAPSVAIYAEDQDPPTLALEARGPQVFWRHQGLGERPRGIYRSVREGRPRSAAQNGALALLSRTIDATALRGQTVRLSADVRVSGQDSHAELSLFVERPEAGTGAREERIVASPSWRRASVEASVAEDAEELSVTVLARGSGTVDVRAFALESVDEQGSRPIPVDGFDLADRELEAWTSGERGYSIELIDDAELEGAPFVRFSAVLVELGAAPFRARPRPGELRDLPLGAGLRVRLPVSLPDCLARRGSGDPPEAPELARPGEALDDPALRAALVCVGWSGLRHFFPYFDEIDGDWEAVLERSLAEVLAARDEAGVRATLQRMIAPLEDGHGRVLGFVPEPLAFVSFARAEGKVVVVAAGEGLDLSPGDLVLAVDDVEIEAALARAATRVSGSVQWIEVQLLREGLITAGPPGTKVRLLLERAGERVRVELPRERWPGGWPTPAHPAYTVHDDGVIYVDLVRVSWQELEARIDELVAAAGLVFDLRGYPHATVMPLLNHLLRRRDRAKWMFVPQLLYPNQACVGWREQGWALRPQRPRLEAKVAFITDGRAISAVESFLGIVEGYGLGDIVGAPTAGANGNSNFVGLPAGYALMFTGMKVRRLDGSQLHARGIPPTIPAEPTIAGIRAGRDEPLERALAQVRA